MKLCFKCNKEKELFDFYKHSKMSDGYLNKCKECTKLDVRTNRNLKLEQYRSYDLERDKDKLSDRYKAKLEYGANYRVQHKIKRKAQITLSNAVRDNKIKRPNYCEFCGITCTPDGHHSSYDKSMWLIITWLCKSCHSRIHNDMKFKLGVYSSADLEQVASIH